MTMSPESSLNTPLVLPCGARLNNRLAKAAMTEGLADEMNRATPALVSLYQRWAANGAGLMLTGNVQIDRRQLERPGNIAIDGNGGFDQLKEMARQGTEGGAHFWMQINHPGRQTPAGIHPRPLSPSAISVPLEMAGCGQAREMTLAEIDDVRRRFVHVASVARETGFTGVQIHAAHGYLLSNFLSPLANQRQDEYGGALENRARLLLEVVADIRGALGADYPISVKLNSADFQRGGFTETESMQVVSWLSEAGIDLLEVSGGNYEQMSMVGLDNGEGGPMRVASTLAREAYFLEFARKIRPLAKMPLMITGGLRSRSAMNQALAEGDCDVVGAGRPFCTAPDQGAELLDGEGGCESLLAVERTLAMARDALGPDVDDATFKTAESFGLLGWYCLQIARMGQGREPDLTQSVFDALMAYKAAETQALERWQRPD